MEVVVKHIEDVPGKSTKFEIVKIYQIGEEKDGGYKIGDKIYKIGDYIYRQEIDEIMKKRIPGLGFNYI